MKKYTLAIVFSVFTVGCRNTTSNDLKSGDVLNASSFECEKSFQSDWCSQNLENTSKMSTVCKGKIHSGDVIYSSIQIKNEAVNFCLVDLGQGSQNVNITGCPDAVITNFSSTEGTVKVLSCNNSAGSGAYIEGTLPNGQVFRAIHIQ